MDANATRKIFLALSKLFTDKKEEASVRFSQVAKNEIGFSNIGYLPRKDGGKPIHFAISVIASEDPNIVNQFVELNESHFKSNKMPLLTADFTEREIQVTDN